MNKQLDAGYIPRVAFALGLLIALLLLAAVVHAQSGDPPAAPGSTGYGLSWWSVDGGEIISTTDDEYSLDGTAVTVAYHPRNPERAILETGPRFGSWLGAIVFGIVAIIGASGFWSALRACRRDRAAPAI